MSTGVQKTVTAIKSNAERGIIAGSIYHVERESEFFYYLKNIGQVKKENFIIEGIIAPPVTCNSALVAKCNVKNAYKNITVGKEYVISRTEKDGCTTYFHIINDAGASARYNSKFFTKPQSKNKSGGTTTIVEKPAEPVIKKGYALCNDPSLGLEKGMQYQVVKETTNTLEILFNGKNGIFLKSRFTIGPK